MMITSSHSILIVDDESSIRLTLTETLLNEGYQVQSVESGEAALDYVARQEFDLVLLDLNLKGIRGTDVLTALRQQFPDIVIIMLTAYASLESAVEAIRQGAQDYLLKPCCKDELCQSIRRGLSSRQQKLRQRELLDQLEHHMTKNLANLRAVIAKQPQVSLLPLSVRQLGTTGFMDIQSTEESEHFLHCEGLVIDFLRHTITLDDHLLELSRTEFDLLAYLIREAPRVISPQELIRQVQRYESAPWEAREIIRSHIYNIRQKFRAVSKASFIIQTIRGMGYAITK